MSSHHGNTPAAWTAVTIGMLGFLIGSIALMLTPVNMLLFWIGLIVAIAPLVIFPIMVKMGLHD